MLFRRLRSYLFASLLAVAPAVAGCADLGSSSDDITDVPHTDVERQSIGNCWLYAQASWVESMHLAATGTKFDASQSYWTYWHWYGELLDGYGSEIETGGGQDLSNDIVLDRGVMPELKFVKEDAAGEMSARQASALSKVNQELATGRLKGSGRRDPAMVRKVLDEAWGLSSTVKGQLTKAFGADGQKTLRSGGTTKYTSIIAPSNFVVRYTERDAATGQSVVRDTTLDVAISEWHVEYYPTYGSNLDKKRRDFQIRVQRALHDRQPVVITWDVDFNAMEGKDPELIGSFNLTTLKKASGPGRQGGHMTVLEDYEAITQAFGTLEAGVTLDPVADKAKLDAALLPTSTVKFFRVKNSWGALRDDRTSAPGFPGYHDLYLDYLNGPIAFCPDVEGTKTAANCKGTTVPFSDVMLPPGY